MSDDRGPAELAVVVGASGGIGRAITDRLRATQPGLTVLPLGRREAVRLDLTDEPSIVAAASVVAGAGTLRLVVDATGLLHGAGHAPERSWRDLDPARLAEAFAINAIGPALLMKHLLPLFPRHGRAVFATLSARVGSIGDNRLGGWYGYRASKAALNQIVRTASIELARHNKAALCLALHPGTVATPLSAPFAKTGLHVQAPAEAAERLLRVIGGCTAEHNGRLVDQHGTIIPW